MLNVIFINPTIINYCDPPCDKGNSVLHNTLPLKTKENQVGTLEKHARAPSNEFFVAVPFSAVIHHN